MKKNVLVLLIFILTTSCSVDLGDTQSTESSSDTLKWNFKVDGVLYKWSGNPKNVMGWGSSTYSVKNSTKYSIQLFSTQDPIISFDFVVPSLTVGTYTLNSIGSAYITDYSGTILNYYTTNKYQIILKITESNINLGSGKIKGTFSGRLFRENSSGVTIVKNITEGYFEAIKE